MYTPFQSEDEVECLLSFGTALREGAVVLVLLARHDEALLVGAYGLFALDPALDLAYRLRKLDVEDDGLSRQRLHKNLRLL